MGAFGVKRVGTLLYRSKGSVRIYCWQDLRPHLLSQNRWLHYKFDQVHAKISLGTIQFTSKCTHSYEENDKITTAIWPHFFFTSVCPTMFYYNVLEIFHHYIYRPNTCEMPHLQCHTLPIQWIHKSCIRDITFWICKISVYWKTPKIVCIVYNQSHVIVLRSVW